MSISAAITDTISDAVNVAFPQSLVGLAGRTDDGESTSRYTVPYWSDESKMRSPTKTGLETSNWLETSRRYRTVIRVPAPKGHGIGGH